MKRILGALIAIASIQAYGYGVGYSSHPLALKNKLLTSEVTGMFSDDGGAGIQARYTQKVFKQVVLDGGVGIGTGDRSRRFFIGGDYELFPDYQNQPRVSVKTTLGLSKEFDESRTNLSLTPIVSKGFSFWGYPAYPFFGLPVGLDLSSDTNTYESTVRASLGATGQLPIDGYEYLAINTELNIDIKDSFTGIFMGVSYPLNF